VTSPPKRSTRPWVLSPEAAARKRRLERALQRAGLTQTALAAELGVSTAYVAMILCGKRTPALAVAKALSDLTGIPATDFIAAPEV